MSPAVAARLAIVAGLALTLEVVVRGGLVPPRMLVAPSVMALRLGGLLGDAAFWLQVGRSAWCILAAFVAAILVGCVVAVALHALPRVRGALEPLIASYYAIPFFVFTPLLVVLLGMNASPIIAVGFLYAVTAVVVGGLNGLDRIPGVLRRTGRMHRLGAFDQARLISIPAAAPHFFAGAKLALGYSITGVLGSEFLLSYGGLGYAISFAYNGFDDRTMYALLLFLLLVVAVLTALLYRAEGAVKHRSGPAAAAPGGEATLPEKAVAGLVVAAVILAAWQAGFAYAGDEALASPAMAWARLGELFASERFWGHVAETGLALGLSLLISCVAGAAIGIALGANRFAGEVGEPIFVTLYALPKVTLYPIVLLFFGIGLTAKVAFGALYGMIPMILIAMNAIRSMNPALLRTAAALRLTRAQTIASVIVPATVPELVTGLRVAFSITLLGVMIGEMFASRRGLGFLIMNSINVNDTATMMAVTALIAVFAVTVNAALLAADKAVHRG